MQRGLFVRRLPVLQLAPGLDVEGFGTFDIAEAVPHDARGTIWNPYAGVLAPRRLTPKAPTTRGPFLKGYRFLEPPRCPP